MHAIAAKMTSRTLRERVSTSLVSQAYAAQAHQMAASTSRPAYQPAPRQVVRQPRGHLGQREHEDQVEEQLERLDALLGLLGRGAHCALKLERV